MNRSFIVVALCFAMPLSGFSQNTLGVLGSSTAAGVGTTTTDSSWVSRVVRFYNNAHVPVTPANVAMSGMTCFQGMPTGYVLPSTYFLSNNDAGLKAADTPFTQHNITKLLSFNPSVVIIGYPTNNYNFYNISEVLFCLDTIRQIVLAAGKQCFITTTQPRNDFSVAARDTLKVLRDSIMQRYGPFAIDFYTGLDSTNGMLLSAYDANPADGGYHLNDAGHALVAQRVIAANIFSTPLPVKLVSFSALLKNSQTVLDWEAAEESSPTVYQVERSTDGAHFDPLTKINGSTSPLSDKYAYTDPEPASGNNYYRLHIVDQSSAFYSPIVLVFNGSQSTVTRTFPVPAHDMLNLEVQSRIRQSVQVQILTETGIILQSFTGKLDGTSKTFAIPIAFLNNGFYFIRMKMSSSGDIVRTFMKE
jgi:hypothetical protein